MSQNAKKNPKKLTKTPAPRVRASPPKPRTSQPQVSFRVNHCPNCGEHFNSLRQEFIAIYRKHNLRPRFPRNVCAVCGLKRREVTIRLEET